MQIKVLIPIHSTHKSPKRDRETSYCPWQTELQRSSLTGRFQQAVTCSMLKIETLRQGVKYFQS